MMTPRITVMRRSAAPSQLHKTQPFKAPFITNKISKAVHTPELQDGGATGEETSQDTSVRSAANVLSLIKKKDTVASHLERNEQLHSLEEEDVKNIRTSTATNAQRPLQLMKDTSNLPTSKMPMPETYGKRKRAYLEENMEPSNCKYYSAVWCKLSKKKHKNWEGDAVLIVKTRSVILKDMDGKDIGKGTGYKLKDLSSLEDGNTLIVGGKEVEIQGPITQEEYESGRCFEGHTAVEVESTTNTIVAPPYPKPKPFRVPMRGSVPTKVISKEASSLYDVSDPNALVMPRPSAQHQWSHNPDGLPVVDVVVEPNLGMQLRPHQKEGVVFLYKCITGSQLKNGCGAILADEMGLGKTLQCIALIWTVLKQGPYGRQPIVKRVLIVTPSSLTVNWGKEFTKWLGKNRLPVYIVDLNNKVENFKEDCSYPVLVVSYEMLIRSIEVINSITFDLMVCDEGHRLKNSNIKTTSLLSKLSCKRRILLTGTPVQNDLQELLALVMFVNPGVFGNSATFRKVFEEPILTGQQPNATQEEKQLGDRRAAELNRLTSLFILRRTQDIINKYLPSKIEMVVFCQPTELQRNLYLNLVSGKFVQRCFSSREAGDHLAAISTLKKLCNHPSLILKSEDEGCSAIVDEIQQFFPNDMDQMSLEENSGKLSVVSCLLWSLAQDGREKIVLVSNYTTTLDMLATLCHHYNYSYLRLDGSTPAAKRQNLVDQFNSIHSTKFVFLLSAKAGGVGLNLSGASRILLYDIDWNPATDLQAMSRVWRDGQTKTVYIYRLLLTGSIEEKIYQRQVSKQGLSGIVVDARQSSRTQFSREELKDLFGFHVDTTCFTHDLMDCQCDMMGSLPPANASGPSQLSSRACQLGSVANTINLNATMDQLQQWQHFLAPFPSGCIKDPHMEAAASFITFVFRNETGAYTPV
ncbi:DNA repair and recombination protein RAD54B-like isoform X2 [Oratosquilla oratoria]|uniref:DNA repair and recombination protein RAD54B-like isoform X2 n=1 Tax=Oratosquilla oratoria TaxID=337810 RepID=UPI003F759059